MLVGLALIASQLSTGQVKMQPTLRSQTVFWPVRTNMQGNYIPTTEYNINQMKSRDSGILFNGNAYVETASRPEVSINTNGFTVCFWFSPSKLDYSNVETDRDYIYIMGKGEPNKHEWAVRMYDKTSTISSKPQRISFYVFNSDGGLGAGSFVQEPVQIGEWIHIAGVVDRQFTYLYKNGIFKRKDDYHNYPVQGTVIDVNPERGNAPLRIGTRNLGSFFEGTIADVRIYQEALSAQNIKDIYDFTKR